MMEVFGDRQQKLLNLLLKKKEGLGAEEIASGLGISRPAVRQHLMALERQGYVEKGDLLDSGGRPTQTYRLSKKGYDLFPKQYSWFSEVLLENLKNKMGSEALRALMRQMGNDVASQAAERVRADALKDRVEKVARLMNDLAYQAEAVLTGKELPGAPPVIEATNCIFHSIASRFPEICEFDLALLSHLTEAKVIHEQCILRGNGTCRFRFKSD